MIRAFAGLSNQQKDMQNAMDQSFLGHHHDPHMHARLNRMRQGKSVFKRLNCTGIFGRNVLY